MWSELRRKLDLKGPIDPDEVAGIPEACTAFEKSAKFSLPESYKSFVATLGPGEIGGYTRIHAPARTSCAGRLRSWPAILFLPSASFHNSCWVWLQS